MKLIPVLLSFGGLIWLTATNEIAQGPSNAASGLGENVTLQCVRGQSQTSFPSWVKDHNVISENGIVTIGDPAFSLQEWNLKISDLRFNLSGYYQCAISVQGQHVEEKGAWLAVFGDTLCGFAPGNFSCVTEYSGVYPPTLQMYRDGHAVSSDLYRNYETGPSRQVQADIHATQLDGHVYGCRMYFRPPGEEGLNVGPVDDDATAPSTTRECGQIYSPATDGGPAASLGGQVTDSTTTGAPAGGNNGSADIYKLSITILFALLLVDYILKY